MDSRDFDNFLKEGENNMLFSEYEIKQSSAWRELFAIQFTLQSFAPKISNKSVCWEMDSYAASLTVTSEIIRHTGSLDLLGTQSHQTSENIKKSRHSRGTPLTLSFILAFFLQSCASKELNNYVVASTHHNNAFSWRKISLPNLFKQI